MNGEIIETLEEEQETWKTTYMDLITLLLCFFILLLSMSTMNLKKFQEVLGSINVYLASGNSKLSIINVEAPIPPPSEKDFLNWRTQDLMAELKTFLQKHPEYSQYLTVHTTPEGEVVLRMNNQIIFLPGEAELNEDALKILEILSHILLKFPDFKLNIQGHTDSTPICTPRFPSNWALSSARATVVLQFFINKKIPGKRLTATGFSDMFPIASNDSIDGRHQNRRVEFVLEAQEK